MKVNVIETGSSGNLYELLDFEGNSIVIEAGMPRQHFIKHREGKIPPEMCIVSHTHADHYKYFGEYQAIIPMSFVSQKKAESENFKVMGFDLKHGDTTSTAFLIKVLKEHRFILFATDIEMPDDMSEYDTLFYALKKYNVDVFLIECNYNDYLFHLANEQQRVGCSRHFSDNDVVNFMRKIKVENPKIILIHGSNRLLADAYTKKYIESKILGSKVAVAVGQKKGVKNIFYI